MWLVLAALLAAAYACSDRETNREPAPPSDGKTTGAYVSVPESWQLARSIPGHRGHVIEKKVPCVRCHSLTKDGMGPVTPDRCASCHEREAQLQHAVELAHGRFGPSAGSDCQSCHAFSVEDAREVHASSSPLPASNQGSAPAGKQLQAAAPTDCIRCHAQPLGHTPAIRVHETSECIKCHQVHLEPRPMATACPECHSKVHTRHAAQGHSDVQVCTACHTNPHEPAERAKATCQECHSKQSPRIPATALFATTTALDMPGVGTVSRTPSAAAASGAPSNTGRGHTACTDCHRAHEFGADQAANCRTCHSSLPVMGAAQNPAHQRCINCHSPHNVRGTPQGACASCHKQVHSDHPTRAGAPCTGCHDPHPQQAAVGAASSGASHPETARPCSSCHQSAPSDRDFHQGVSCRECHRPHEFLANAKAACSECHLSQVTHTASAAGHADCQGCHRGLPHAPAVARSACDACHRYEARQVHAGHENCRQCHEPHSGAVETACSTCHGAESASAPPGHQKCTGCHDQHAALPVKASCGSCHRQEQQSAHGKIASGCGSCHRPHGPTGPSQVPACTSCHQISNLGGLHEVAKHAGSCTSCHSGHGARDAVGRATCLGCHSDRTQHFPDANRCTSCHLFGARR
ncbi:MAG TPA: hypothetical protein VFQ61_10585 [Polyangiaceae bacterium]|nr:hypothetical protein [Polyangiaceae bacterium]